ncbi:uncharacterized protein TRAVEDRAFT_47339 [Trametes versicolor FP-101664 SS1]|uniref:uncharacterized protein n=1 Tax=Trametes versicolor (strain FP-101664) TaxID=717944 RepID=UPI0004621C2A|nr:uncharacterized protein TRAVEDRAFT_47339 [Trametes versicolor FP-101664 SS1]EIW58165.1 hypothetical protein TRAVEDRAFT_47339 [Trametes versicolor FP-101664 SS1]
MTALAPRNSSPHSGRPHVWATTRKELCQIIPEFGLAQNDIVFGNSETPLLFVDGPSWEDDRWDGGRTIELSMVREFTRVIPGFAVSHGDNHTAQNAQQEAPPQPPVVEPSGNLESQVIEISEGTYVFASEESRQGTDATARCAPAHSSIAELPSVSTANTASTLYLTTLAEEPHPPVIEQDDGLYTFVQEAFIEGEPIGCPPIHDPIPQLPPFSPELGTSQLNASHSVITSHDFPQASPSINLTGLVPIDAPPEIEALLLSRTAGIPIRIVLCRNAAVSPLTPPDGCGCAFLGFFFVVDVQTSAEVHSWEALPGERPTTLVRGRKTWHFRFEWTPGGEDPDSIVAPQAQPWWQVATTDHERTNGDGAMPLQHSYTLLPLHFLAPPAQIVCTDADNLCFQRCGTCSTANGLPPISVEYVRQVRGTDPTAFPWDRYLESVSCVSSDCPDGLRCFTYGFSSTAFVHHMFTCNRPEAQAEATLLFHDLQAEVELISEPNTRGRGGSPYYSCAVSRPSARSTTPDAFWSSVPTSVSRARDLMLKRVHASPYPAALNINVLTISAWRTAGNKKGCVFAAQTSPIVFLCLGADVEMSFWRNRGAAAFVAQTIAATANAPLPRSASPDEEFGLGDIEEPYEPLVDKGDECIDSADSTPAAESNVASLRRPKPAVKGKGRPSGKRNVEEALMVTLVHGDVLVVHGAVFEYSIKRMGMSIVLYGQ